MQGVESAQNLTPEKYRGWRKALQLMVTHQFGEYARSIVLSFCLTTESEVLTMNLHNYTHYALPTLFQGTPLSVADSETIRTHEGFSVFHSTLLSVADSETVRTHIGSQCFKAHSCLLLTQKLYLHMKVSQCFKAPHCLLLTIRTHEGFVSRHFTVC